MYDKTCLESFNEKAAANPNNPFLHQPFGDQWETYTWGEVGSMARKVAHHLQSLNLREKAHIGLVSKNCREWIIADLAIMMAGYVSVPFFPTLTGEQIGEVLELGDVDALFVGKLEVWENMKSGVPADMPVISFPAYADNDKVERGKKWSDIISTSPELTTDPTPHDDDIWTIIFTSGTTGTPKGVMLAYATQIALMANLYDRNPLRADYGGANRYFSFLPLNHVAERGTIEMMCFTHGGEIFFTESIDRFAANLKDASPTFFFAVPRIWTKLRQGVLKKMPQEKLSTLLKIPLISWYVRRKIRGGLGLDKSRRNVSGAAFISQEMKDWWGHIGIPISEAYAMTENGAVGHMLDAEEQRKGSVGQTLPGTECKIDPETSEVLVRSSNTMVGYYKSPEKTAETLAGGWLHTGDQGRVDKDGFLYLTGRVKDTFKTAKGEYVVPQPIEDKFAGINDIEQLCLLGLGQPQPVLVATLSETGDARSRDAVLSGLKSKLEEINGDLGGHEKIAAIVVTSEDFTVENGLLTPTLKVKRTQVHERYTDQLGEWSQNRGKVIFMD
ncbi:AMP-binding protein [Neolewinella antarctica]|uniref:Long-subunit acyl-CoA synthetase (AMP-forming) n=1 Tax=Neolewinella antarctica TaxID=442734 RepID=A0ABX0X801_9BACT|nr:AMP-binding protein [Neolewinella antarctica]NJC24993.1 long-subunit acyl-CoA synthetase (AMP-forming) [Neolewinella antarctica]